MATPHMCVQHLNLEAGVLRTSQLHIYMLFLPVMKRHRITHLPPICPYTPTPMPPGTPTLHRHSISRIDNGRGRHRIPYMTMWTLSHTIVPRRSLAMRQGALRRGKRLLLDLPSELGWSIPTLKN